MFYDPTRPARFAAALIALVAMASLVAQFIVVREEYGYSVARSIWVMARFLTILTTVLVAGTFAAIAAGAGKISYRWLAALTLAILLVAAGFHTLLRGNNVLVGLEVWSDLGFHTVGPVLVALFWLFLVPRGRLAFSDLPFFLIWPSAYLVYALTRGGLEGRYPYPFLDVAAIGWTPVLWTIGAFTVGVVAGGLGMILLDRVLGRSGRRAAP